MTAAWTRQDRPHCELVPQDLAQLRDEVNWLLVEPLAEPGIYVGRVRESVAVSGEQDEAAS